MRGWCARSFPALLHDSMFTLFLAPSSPSKTIRHFSHKQSIHSHAANTTLKMAPSNPSPSAPASSFEMAQPSTKQTMSSSSLPPFLLLPPLLTHHLTIQQGQLSPPHLPHPPSARWSHSRKRSACVVERCARDGSALLFRAQFRVTSVSFRGCSGKV